MTSNHHAPYDLGYTRATMAVSYTHLDVYKRQGLGSAVCECLSEKAPTPVKRIGIYDVYGESGPALELLHKYGLDGEGIYRQTKKFLEK